MTKHVAWTSINNFHNLRKGLQAYPHMLGNNGSVKTYQAKVKLHGTNAGVRIDRDGTVTAFSRTQIITPDNDNEGFAKWVFENKDKFSKLRPSTEEMSVVVYGEWCGKGIKKGVAISNIDKKIFAVFATRYIHPTLGQVITCPDNLQTWFSTLIGNMPDLEVIPWFKNGQQFYVDWLGDADQLTPALDNINKLVEEVENCDPWVLDQFGVKGVGEGLVFYPITNDYESFCSLTFKAKGEKHQILSKNKPVQIDATVTNSLNEFAELVITQSRLEQGAYEVNNGVLGFSYQNIGPFLAWINQDIIKEAQAELEASSLDKRLALKACSDRARAMYLNELKKL